MDAPCPPLPPRTWMIASSKNASSSSLFVDIDVDGLCSLSSVGLGEMFDWSLISFCLDRWMRVSNRCCCCWW